ncbi:hypothetical protein PUN28_001556 [Cardiocondyla obscurior]|uniref:Secreted protein n=1 Tax=Cardiocondyla obscurior TaxID=286306 RepID=A0AAW2H621_9HYME
MSAGAGALAVVIPAMTSTSARILRVGGRPVVRSRRPDIPRPADYFPSQLLRSARLTGVGENYPPEEGGGALLHGPRKERLRFCSTGSIRTWIGLTLRTAPSSVISLEKSVQCCQ